MLEKGQMVDGKYRVLGTCGRGGMSVVYRAVNERTGQIWAIKEVEKGRRQDLDTVSQNLLAEAEILKRLDHPCLPRIVDVIDQRESYLIVLDYIEGKTLDALVREQGPAAQDQVIAWGRQLCQVLGYLHARNPPIIYRDMKPANIMKKPDGAVVLFDFGTAREYKTASLEDTACLGTRGYAAPEQYGGHGQTDRRTDIYCLGATLYHLLTGHNPGEPPYAMYPIRRWNPRLSAGLEAILAKCTRENPRERYQSCQELQYALEHYWEVDAAYQRQQRKKLRKFFLPAFLGTAFFLGTLGAYGAEKYVTENSYEAYLTAAEHAASKEEEIRNYRRAISLEPSRSEGYLGLLQNGFLDDRLLTVEESRQLRETLIAYGKSGKTNEMLFRENKKGYEQFAYEAGVAYYYRFEDKSSKKNARSYFAAASTSETLEEKKVERARRLYLISDYYSRIGLADETGDAMVTFRDYWLDLTELSEGNLVESDNGRTALIMYQELAAQIISRAAEFQKSGVTREEMEGQIREMREHLERDFQAVSQENREMLEEDRKSLQEALKQAERVVESAFQRPEQEEEKEEVWRE